VLAGSEGEHSLREFPVGWRPHTKNFRYVLNHSRNKTHRCLEADTGGKAVVSVTWFSAGNGSNNTGILEDGVVPSKFGVLGDKKVLDGFSVVSTLAAIDRLCMWTFMPFSASSNSLSVLSPDSSSMWEQYGDILYL
jgi:hypothetical protein